MNLKEIAEDVVVQDAYEMYNAKPSLMDECEVCNRIAEEYIEFFNKCAEEVFEDTVSPEDFEVKCVKKMFEILGPLIEADMASRELDKDLERSSEL